MVLSALVVAGCGGDDGDSGGSAPAVGSADDPATVVPAGAPVVISFTTDVDGEQAKSALTFASRVEPSNRDLRAELLKALEDDELSYSKDVQPWVGDRAVFALEGVMGEEPAGVLAVATDDEAAAQKALDKANDGTDVRDGNYKGTKYAIGEDGASSGIVDGFVVASDSEENFKAAIDAAAGSSLADDSKYKDTVALAEGDNLGSAYVDVDGFLELLEESGASAQFDPKTIPGFEPGQTALATLAAEDDKMTFETASTADAPSTGGPNVADLPAGSWLAIAGAVQGEQFLEGFNQGVAAAGEPQAAQLLEQLGIQEFLGGLEDISMSFGGETLTGINGQVTIGGSDQAAASKLLKQSVQFAQQAAQGQVQIDVKGDTATALAGPYRLQMEAKDGDLKLAFGDQPSGKLGDDDGYKQAESELGLDDGKVVGFLDFVPLEKLLQNVPQDAELMEALKVISQMESVVVGSGTADDATRARAIVTLR